MRSSTYRFVMGAMLVALVSIGQAHPSSIMAIDWMDRGAWTETSPFDPPLFNDFRSVDRAVAFLVSGDSGGARRMVAEFDISGVNKVNSVEYVELSFLTGRTQIGDSPMDLHGFAGNGVAESADVRKDNLLESFVVPATRDDVVEWKLDVTDLVTDLIFQDVQYVAFTWRIQNDLGLNGPDHNTFIFAPQRGSAEAQLFAGPRLNVSVVPLPAAAWLLLSGLGILGYTGWRKKES